MRLALKGRASGAHRSEYTAGRYEFAGRAEGILSGVCGLHPFIKRHGAFAAGLVPGRTYEMDKAVKEAHFCKGTQFGDITKKQLQGVGLPVSHKERVYSTVVLLLSL